NHQLIIGQHLLILVALRDISNEAQIWVIESGNNQAASITNVGRQLSVQYGPNQKYLSLNTKESSLRAQQFTFTSTRGIHP
ncbi:17002_t:CDS:1, partial [Racocetra persica]